MIENLIVGRNKLSVLISVKRNDDYYSVHARVLKQTNRDSSYWNDIYEYYTDRGNDNRIRLVCEASPQLSESRMYLRGTSRYKDHRNSYYTLRYKRDAYSYANALVKLITRKDLGKSLSLSDYGYVYDEGDNRIRRVDRSICEHCLGTFSKSELNQGRVCNNCLSEYYHCKRCDSLYPKKHKMLKIKDDEYCCECILSKDEKLRNSIRSYNYKPSDFQMYGTPANRDFYGIEIEAEINQASIDELGVSKEEIASIVEKFNPHTYIVHDGSIRYGFEVVTQPCSYDYHKEHTVETLNMLNNVGMFGDKTNSCGLHVHISREAFRGDVHMGNFVWLFKTFEEEIYKFSRRTNRDWSYRYCKPVAGVDMRSNLGVSGGGKDKSDLSGLAKSFYRAQCGQDRYSTVNMQNPYTVEVRILDGTTTPDIFLACLQFCRVAMEITKKFDFLEKSFVENFTGHFDELDKLISSIF